LSQPLVTKSLAEKKVPQPGSAEARKPSWTNASSVVAGVMARLAVRRRHRDMEVIGHGAGTAQRRQVAWREVAQAARDGETAAPLELLRAAFQSSALSPSAVRPNT
jgi:hypothetical protein